MLYLFLMLVTTMNFISRSLSFQTKSTTHFAKSFSLTMRSRSTYHNFEEKFKGANYESPVTKAIEREYLTSTPMPVVILMSPFLDQNVGSVSRGMYVYLCVCVCCMCESMCGQLSMESYRL